MRDTIRDAAIREFARNGLVGTSTQAIADAAGISKAQLHYYIASKEELYQDVLGYILSEWREIFFVSSSRDDPETAIRSYVGNKVRHALEHPDISRLFAMEMARGAPEMTEHWPGLKAAVEEASAVIQSWIDDGKIAPVDPLLFQINMWAVAQHYAEYEAQTRMLMGTGQGDPLDADRIADEAIQLFLVRCGLAKP
ncbi:TetR family transcriptional regulator C-terminal domain-containing protein [Mameliella sediminis]|uniref:TetR family transcriptional regulator C-terminal domain-containing protein n=1 Tax=Mameliella sediminis TaxID=2836866 RepID=UPI001C493302|nr:TetR family transcriptional regulator C-terminal domain-containing protein [Mameliella sediminis]MBV7396572.1 TetR family transcriptional regulator C-terminal domain-containing protein [Mameliella sediminis]MBY6117162.1 TetR family transcriptional regulator C-terminal domain-containing protein [Antarctobacter heliothermus]